MVIIVLVIFISRLRYGGQGNCFSGFFLWPKISFPKALERLRAESIPPHTDTHDRDPKQNPQKDSWQHFLTLEPARESDDYHRCEKWWIAIAWVVLGHTIVNHRPIAWHCSQRHISNLSHAFMTRRFERKWPVEKLGKEMSYISEFSSQLNKNAIWRHLGENTDITQSYCRLPHGTGLLPNIFAPNRNPAPHRTDINITFSFCPHFDLHNMQCTCLAWYQLYVQLIAHCILDLYVFFKNPDHFEQKITFGLGLIPPSHLDNSIIHGIWSELASLP